LRLSVEGSLPPEETTDRFLAAINGSDLESATYWFARDACLLTPDATAVRGRHEIRPILRQLIAAESQIEVRERSVITAGHVALGLERWSVASKGATGGAGPFVRDLTPTLVLRWLEGTWKLAVAMPWSLQR
jgi:ketosteroid isomerase-like protein